MEFKEYNYLKYKKTNFNIDKAKLVYKQLCKYAKNRKWNDDDVYGEVHHIKPRCLGGSDNKRNLVKLTFPEHCFAHYLLAIMYPKTTLVFALEYMLNNKIKKDLFSINFSEFAEIIRIKQNYSKQSSLNTKKLNKKQWSKLNKRQRRKRTKNAIKACHTKEALEKRKKTMKELYYDNPNSIYYSKEHLKKCSENGKSFSKEHFQKMGKAAWENKDNHEKMNPNRFNQYVYDKRCIDCGTIRTKCSINANKCPECGSHNCKEIINVYDKETLKKLKINIKNRTLNK